MTDILIGIAIGAALVLVAKRIWERINMTLCNDCGGEAECYIVHDALDPTRFEDANDGKEEYFCIGCFERRLGRKLTEADFPDLMIARR
jgi:hypothetical protein